jgi:hypothetical protein
VKARSVVLYSRVVVAAVRDFILFDILFIGRCRRSSTVGV